MKTRMLMNTEALFDFERHPKKGIIYHKTPVENQGLDDITSQVFFQVPAGAVVRYSEGKSRIEPDEQYQLLKFNIHEAIIGHHTAGHIRKHSRRPFYDHSLDALRFIARWGVSAIAQCPLPLHDLEEEWTSNKPVSLSQKHVRKDHSMMKEYHKMSTAMFLGIGIMNYKFVNEVFDSPERFYPHINSIMRVVNNMTRRLDENYFSNLDDIFYDNTKNEPEVWEKRISSMRDVYDYLDKFFGLGDREEIKRFIDDVYNHQPTKGEREKNRRRTIMGDIADVYANANDFESTPMKRRASIIAKSFMILNEVRRLYAVKRTEEGKEGLNRIMDECSALERELYRKKGIIDSTLKEIPLSDEGKQEIDHELEEYQRGYHLRKDHPFNRMTSQEHDSSSFAGTLNTCIRVLRGEEKAMIKEDNPREQYAFFRSMMAQISAHHWDRERYVSGLSAKYHK